MPDPLVKEATALYARPREEFTAARNLRAKELKKEDAELAAAVAALPKPTVASAAVNDLVREDPSEVRALVQSGKRLRQAQERAVAGKQGPDLAAAIEEHRAALDRVGRDLRRRKLSGPNLEKALRTLRVASIDPDTQPQLERGTLSEDLAAAGFGLDPALVPAKPRAGARKKAAPKPDRAAEEKRRREARDRLRDAEEELVEAQNRARTALREVERAEAQVEKARRAVDDAG